MAEMACWRRLNNETPWLRSEVLLMMDIRKVIDDIMDMQERPAVRINSATVNPRSHLNLTNLFLPKKSDA